MDINVERILQSIERGDRECVQTQLDKYNSEHSQCFFFNVEAKERRKLQELEEFRQNKVRSYIPDSDSDSSDESDALILRRRLAAALIWFVQSQTQPVILKTCLSTLRILSRDRQALAPFITDSAILTLARLAGITCLCLPPTEEEEEEEEEKDSGCGSSAPDGCTHKKTDWNPSPSSDGIQCRADSNATDANSNRADANSSRADANSSQADANSSRADSLSTPEVPLAAAAVPKPSPAGRSIDTCRSKPHDMHGHLKEVVIETCYEQRQPNRAGGNHSGMLARGKRDARGEREEEGEECNDNGESWRKEAMKALCNVIYNSQRAQERASALRILTGLSEKIKNDIHSPSPPSGQFYDLRLLFLLTALRPELRQQLLQARGVSLLTAALEQCLEVHWRQAYEVVTDSTAPSISKDTTECAVEILKTLFNITYTARRRIPDEEDEAQYRHLVAMLCHCLLLSCEEEDSAEELKGHTVNLLSVLPLECLDILLSVRLSEGSRESHGINMDSVHTLLLFMERRLDRGHKLKEKLTPVLNLLTESCRAHPETRHYLKQQILPPLKEVVLRPEQGHTLRNKLVRLMTHVDTDLKHCAAELIFVLCKENVSRFVKYTGFGNAAGLLAARGLLGGHGPSPQPQYSSDSDSDTEEYRRVRDRINPVTGRVEEPQPDPMEGMSEEEREAEAISLVSMFSRLARHKIIQPMRVAADGRLAPLCGQMRNNILEEEEGEENEESCAFSHTSWAG
ncbi:chaperone Ric-8A [Brachyhypopomus gauderio]|uniref:chaperone Ric-8A n=1 Tax=Brachyhypopomus gauderio TaxID=698409 RepID=UPI0040422194